VRFTRQNRQQTGAALRHARGHRQRDLQWHTPPTGRKRDAGWQNGSSMFWNWDIPLWRIRSARRSICTPFAACSYLLHHLHSGSFKTNAVIPRCTAVYTCLTGIAVLPTRALHRLGVSCLAEPTFTIGVVSTSSSSSASLTLMSSSSHGRGRKEEGRRQGKHGRRRICLYNCN